MPDLTMPEACELWRQGLQCTADLSLPNARHAARSSERAQANAADAVMAAENACLAADHPRLALRHAILDHAAVALHLEAMSALSEEERKALLQGYEEGMDEMFCDAWHSSAAAWSLLRLYAHLKYDDAAPDDWFHHFMRVAAPYIREKVRLAREHVLRMDEGSGRVVEIYDRLLQELRDGIVKARPKQRFVPPDLT